MLRYRSKRTGSPLHSTGIETQGGAQAKDTTQNQVTSFFPSPGRLHQSKPSQVLGGARPRFIYPQAGFAVTLLLLLIFSGPPKFRIRDVEASLRGEMDWVVVLHILVWGLAGAWVLFQIAKHGRGKNPLKGLGTAQELGLAMILCLAVSAVVEKAPALSAFKIYQMAVSLLFTQIFVDQFGYTSCLKRIFWGTALLCGAIAVCAYLAPDLVWTGSDFNPDPSRLKGDLIAPSGSVSALAIILLLTGVRKIWRVLPLALLGLFF